MHKDSTSASVAPLMTTNCWSHSSVARGMNSRDCRHEFDSWPTPLSDIWRSSDGLISNPEGLPNPTFRAGSSVVSHLRLQNALNEGPTFKLDHVPIPLHY